MLHLDCFVFIFIWLFNVFASSNFRLSLLAAMSYVHHLELLGLWEWAIYVILNIPSQVTPSLLRLQSLLPASSTPSAKSGPGLTLSPSVFTAPHAFKEQTVRELIARHVPELQHQPDKRRFLVDVCFG
jgi:hypothetical protein